MAAAGAVLRALRSDIDSKEVIRSGQDQETSFDIVPREAFPAYSAVAMQNVPAKSKRDGPTDSIVGSVKDAVNIWRPLRLVKLMKASDPERRVDDESCAVLQQRGEAGGWGGGRGGGTMWRKTWAVMRLKATFSDTACSRLVQDRRVVETWL